VFVEYDVKRKFGNLKKMYKSNIKILKWIIPIIISISIII